MFGRFGGGQRGGARRQANGRGADLRTMVEIGLEEAYAGTKKTVRVPSSRQLRGLQRQRGRGRQRRGADLPDLPGRGEGAGRSRASS